VLPEGERFHDLIAAQPALAVPHDASRIVV
jgi:hypothetical protein